MNNQEEKDKELDLYLEVIFSKLNAGTTVEDEDLIIVTDILSLPDRSKLKSAIEVYKLISNDYKTNNCIKYHSRLGDLYALLDKHKWAIICYEAVLKVDKGNIEIMEKKANLLKESGRLNESRESYKKILQINSESKSSIAGLQQLDRMENEGPFELDSFHKALECHLKEFLLLKTLIEEHNISNATRIVLVNIDEWVNPKVYSVETIEEIKGIYNGINTIKMCKEWVKERLNFDLSGDDQEEWEIGEGEDCSYKDKNLLLKAIDWELVDLIVNMSWANACSKDGMEYIQEQNELLEHCE